MTAEAYFSLIQDLSGPMFPLENDTIREKVNGWDGEISNNCVGKGHFGIILDGTCELILPNSRHNMTRGCYFSVTSKFNIVGGRGLLISVPRNCVLNTVGGPVEHWGRLKYIDGCTDTLLIAPVRRGEPCLNALFFPRGINQTPHTHPSVRLGAVLSGTGYCKTDSGKFLLCPGMSFCIPAGMRHSFHTSDASLTVVAYHPDSDFGPLDEDHPMINRTIVDGVPANEIPTILTL
jgi:quercetin dioxygenase-like cupin family protein